MVGNSHNYINRYTLIITCLKILTWAGDIVWDGDEKLLIYEQTSAKFYIISHSVKYARLESI